MKVDKQLKQHAQGLSEHHGRDDFWQSGYSIPGSIRTYAEWIKSQGPKELLAKVKDLEFALRTAELEFKTQNESFAFAFGMAVGNHFAALRADLTRVRGNGRPEPLIWKYVRKIAADHPDMKKRSICYDAILALKKDHRKARKPKLDYLVKHFAEHV